MRLTIVSIVLEISIILCSFQCSTAPSASGGDDFPNMIADAGVIMTDNLQQEWDNPATATGEALAITYAEIPFPDLESLALGEKSHLSKSILSGDTSGLSIDQETGNITWFRTRHEAPWVHYDTIVFRITIGDTLIVSIAGRKVSLQNEELGEYYSLTDGDGDGLLVNSTASVQDAEVKIQSWKTLGVSELLSMKISAGEDGRFDDTLDNAIIAASFARMQDGDTVYAVTLEDADGDGEVSGILQQGDSALVDVNVMYDARRDNALLAGQETYTRMVVFNDTTKNYAVRYSVVNHYLRRSITWGIITVHGDSTFLPGDTVEVIRLTDADGEDTLTADTMRVRVVLGSDPRDSLDDAVLSIFVHTIFDGAENREVLFEFASTNPIPAGSEPETGTLHCKVTGRDKRWIDIDALVEESEITAEVRTSTGTVYDVRWDRKGEVVAIIETE